MHCKFPVGGISVNMTCVFYSFHFPPTALHPILSVSADHMGYQTVTAVGWTWEGMAVKMCSENGMIWCLALESASKNWRLLAYQMSEAVSFRT